MLWPCRVEKQQRERGGTGGLPEKALLSGPDGKLLGNRFSQLPNRGQSFRLGLGQLQGRGILGGHQDTDLCHGLM